MWSKSAFNTQNPGAEWAWFLLHLVKLDLHHNELTGTLPEAWAWNNNGVSTAKATGHHQCALYMWCMILGSELHCAEGILLAFDIPEETLSAKEGT